MKNKPKMEIKKGTVKRLFSYVNSYKLLLIIVFICIIVSAAAGVCGSLFLRELVDDNIVPMIENDSRDYTPLVNAIIGLIGIYFVGLICTYVYKY